MLDYANQIASHHHPREAEKLSNRGVAMARPVSFFLPGPAKRGINKRAPDSGSSPLRTLSRAIATAIKNSFQGLMGCFFDE